MPILFAILFSLLLTACQPNPRDNNAEQPQAAQPPLPTQALNLKGPNGVSLTVVAEIADEEAERESGLMFRTSLVSGTGMLFVFPEPKRLSFWMKNTPLPLDLVYFRAGQQVATIPWARPFDESPLSPAEAADMVLEVPGGWAVEHGIGPGWQLTLAQAIKAED